MIRLSPHCPLLKVLVAATFVVGLTDFSADAADFVDVTPSLFTDMPGGSGVAWVDFDGDGDLDISYTTTSEVFLFRHEGGGVWTNATPAVMATVSQGTGQAWGDYDNDGYLDLYLATEGGRPKALFRYAGTGFEDVTPVEIDQTEAQTGTAWADFDRDGDLDLYATVHQSGRDRLWRNEGGARFVDVADSSFLEMEYGGSVAWADYDNDGDPDFYVTNPFGQNHLVRNDGGGMFADVTMSPVDLRDFSMGVAWGDYDNDGDLDLYVTNQGTSGRLLKNENSGSSFADATPSGMINTDAGTGVAWGDYDNDGDLDLFVGYAFAANRLFRNEGGGVFFDDTPRVLADGGNTTGVAWGDYDSDGDLDLVIAGSNGGATNYIYENRLANGAAWFHVRLEGTVSNRAGIGARVRLVAGGVTQIREITAGSGWQSQNALMAVFGLGGAALVDTLTVSWPSGIQQTFTGEAINQTLKVTEELIPAPPTGCAATTAICEHTRITWVDESDNEDGFEVNRDGELIATLGPGAEQFEDPDGLPGLTYDYDVLAFNGTGKSNVCRASGMRRAPPDQPEDLVASDTSCARIRLDWPAVPDVEEYRVYREGELQVVLSPSQLSFDDDVPAGSYDYMVTAWNSCGESEPAVGTGTTLPVESPEPESPLSPEAVLTPPIDFKWSVVDGAAAYLLQIAKDSLFIDLLVDTLLAPTETLFTLNAINGPAQLHWRIGAEDNCGDKAYSEVIRINASPARPLGDLNRDYLIDIQDVGQGVQFALALESLTAEDSVAADLNGDGAFDVSDLVALVGIVATKAAREWKSGGLPAHYAQGSNADFQLSARGIGEAGTTACVDWTYRLSAGSQATVLFFENLPVNLDISGRHSHMERLDDVAAYVWYGGEPLLSICAGNERVGAEAASDTPSMLLAGALVAGPEGGRPVYVALDRLLFATETMPPAAPRLLAAYPNPFNPHVTVPFEIPRTMRVQLSIYDISGRLVRALLDNIRASGLHEIVWDGTNDTGSEATSGIYLYELRTVEGRTVRRFALLR